MCPISTHAASLHGQVASVVVAHHPGQCREGAFPSEGAPAAAAENPRQRREGAVQEQMRRAAIVVESDVYLHIEY